jgi:hypothetical protein
MAELALDDVQRHALTRELERVRVAQLVRREPTPDARLVREAPEFAADGGARSRPPAGRAVDDAEQRPDRQLGPCAQPRPKLLPAPLVHPDLAPPAALAAADQHRSAPRIQVVPGQSERLGCAPPARQSTTMIARSRHP